MGLGNLKPLLLGFKGRFRGSANVHYRFFNKVGFIVKTLTWLYAWHFYLPDGGGWGERRLILIFMFQIFIEIGWCKVFSTGTPRPSPLTNLTVEIHLEQVFGMCGLCGIIVGSNFQGRYKEARPCPPRYFSSTSSYVSFHFQPSRALSNSFSFSQMMPLPIIYWNARLCPWISDNQMLASGPLVASNAGPIKTDSLRLLLYSKGQFLWAASSLAVSCECSISQSACEV